MTTVRQYQQKSRQSGHEVAYLWSHHEDMNNTTLLRDDHEPAPTPPGAGRSRDHRPSAITTEGLVRTFAGMPAVDGLDLDIHQGEIYGFLGPNGAGKSTTVRVLCTLLAPSAGRAVVAGHDVAKDPGQARLRIGVALQDAALDPRQTGEELLRLQGRLYGLSRREIDERVGHLMELVDIGDAMRRPIGTYSGGMRRRLDLAAALVHNPEVLFLDEPTTGLDPESRLRVWEEVRRLNDELSMTIFLTTQYLEEADELADRVGIINAGRLVAEGTPGELKRRVGNDVIVARVDGGAGDAIACLSGVDGVQDVDARASEVVVTAASGAATVGPVAVALANAGIVVRDLTLRTPTLDDVFLELTGTHIRPSDNDHDEAEEVKQ
jgi:ABC-2 type transport system ATP-binding protein